MTLSSDHRSFSSLLLITRSSSRVTDHSSLVTLTTHHSSLSLLVTRYCPRHFERAGLVAEALALGLVHVGFGAAVAEDRLHEVADRARAVDRAVAGIVGVDHPSAVRRLLESDAPELLILIVEQRVFLEELRQLVRVEDLVDLADPELRGCGADEREHVRLFRSHRFVDRAIELDERLELAPGRRQRCARVLRGARRELGEDLVHPLFADGVAEELLASAEHEM